MRQTDIHRITKILLSMAQLLGVRSLAIIVPEESDIQEVYSTVDNYYMSETYLESDGKTYIKMKSQTDVNINSVESWKFASWKEVQEFDMIFRIKEWW